MPSLTDASIKLGNGRLAVSAHGEEQRRVFEAISGPDRETAMAEATTAEWLDLLVLRRRTSRSDRSAV